MLVLSRRPGEEIIINGNIRVTIVSVKGDRVRIGVDAPGNVPVDRAEVHNERKEFGDVPSHVFAGHHDEEAIAIGVAPIKGSADETAIH